MTNTPKQEAPGSTSRAEKLSILSAMLGPDAMARIRDAASGDQLETTSAEVEVDVERATWHRNRLLERLRQQGVGRAASANRTPAPGVATGDLKDELAPYDLSKAESSIGVANTRLDARLANFSDGDTLAFEHPAIIARLIKRLSRDARVDALKSLPGPVARSIVRRLR